MGMGGIGTIERDFSLFLHRQIRKVLQSHTSICNQIVALKDKKEGGLKLINASWIWTEPHSKRLKVRLSVQRQVMHGAILQQVYILMRIVVACPY